MLTCHRSAADDRLVEFESLDHCRDRTDVCVLVVCMIAWKIVAPGK